MPFRDLSEKLNRRPRFSDSSASIPRLDYRLLLQTYFRCINYAPPNPRHSHVPARCLDISLAGSVDNSNPLVMCALGLMIANGRQHCPKIQLLFRLQFSRRFAIRTLNLPRPSRSPR